MSMPLFEIQHDDALFPDAGGNLSVLDLNEASLAWVCGVTDATRDLRLNQDCIWFALGHVIGRNSLDTPVLHSSIASVYGYKTLRDLGYESCTPKEADDTSIILYGDQLAEDILDVAHVARYIGEGRAVSKFGSLFVWNHPAATVPRQYGTKALYMRDTLITRPKRVEVYDGEHPTEATNASVAEYYVEYREAEQEGVNLNELVHTFDWASNGHMRVTLHVPDL